MDIYDTILYIQKCTYIPLQLTFFYTFNIAMKKLKNVGQYRQNFATGEGF